MINKISGIYSQNYNINQINITFKGDNKKSQAKENFDNAISIKNHHNFWNKLPFLTRVGIPILILTANPSVTGAKEAISDKNNTQIVSVATKDGDFWEKVKEENEAKKRAMNGEPTAPIRKFIAKSKSKIKPIKIFIDENGFEALRKAQQSKGRATVIAGENKGILGYGESFITELLGEYPDLLRGVAKRGSDGSAWTKDKTQFYNGDNKALKTLNILSDISQMFQGTMQGIEGGAAVATGAFTFEKWRNDNIDKNIERINSELAKRALNMTDANAHDSKTILKGDDRMIMAFGEEQYKKMKRKERQEFAKLLPKEMTLEHAVFIKKALGELPLEDFSKETLIMLSKLAGAQFAAKEHAELKTNYITEGLKLFYESKTNFRDGTSKVLRFPSNLIGGIGEVTDIKMTEKNSGLVARVADGFIGNKGILGVASNTLATTGNALNTLFSSIDTEDGSTSRLAQSTLDSSKNIGKYILNSASLGLTNAFDVWGDFENALVETTEKPEQTKTNEQYISARQLRNMMVQVAEDAFIDNYNKKLDAEIANYVAKAGEDAYATVLAGEQNPDVALLKKAEQAKIQAIEDTTTKLQAARKQAMQLVNMVNKYDARRQARLAEYNDTLFDLFKFEKSNVKNYGNDFFVGNMALCFGEGLIKAIPYELLFESNMSANTMIIVPFSYLIAGVKMCYEGTHELNDARNLADSDKYNTALRQEATQQAAKGLAKVLSGTAVALVPMMMKAAGHPAGDSALRSSSSSHSSGRATSNVTLDTTANSVSNTASRASNASVYTNGMLNVGSSAHVSATTSVAGASAVAPASNVVAAPIPLLLETHYVKESAKSAVKDVSKRASMNVIRQFIKLFY